MIHILIENGRALVAVIIGAMIVAVAGGVSTDVGPWYQTLRFPSIRPPNWIFAPVWTTIFALVCVAFVVTWNDTQLPSRRLVLISLYLLNGALNIAWSPLFFKLKRPDWALIELIFFWLSILAMILFTLPLSAHAAIILCPYIVWVTFAGWLNWRIVQLNAPFTRARPLRHGQGQA